MGFMKKILEEAGGRKTLAAKILKKYEKKKERNIKIKQ